MTGKKYRVRIDDATIATSNSWTVLYPVSFLVEGDSPEAYEETTSRFSQRQVWLAAVEMYRYEVNNGGHFQYYWNRAGTGWRNALKGLEEIGAGAVASVLLESVRRLDGEPPLDWLARQEVLEGRNKDFNDLDAAYYNLEEALGLENLTMEYIRQHRTDFYFDGDLEE